MMKVRYLSVLSIFVCFSLLAISPVLAQNDCVTVDELVDALTVPIEVAETGVCGEGQIDCPDSSLCCDFDTEYCSGMYSGGPYSCQPRTDMDPDPAGPLA